MSKNRVMGKEKIMWENSEFKVEFSKCDMKEFERVMLSSGQCSFFMPMGFMGSENGEAICYDCSGFSPLSMSQDRANRGCSLPPGTSSSDPGKSGGISDHTG